MVGIGGLWMGIGVWVAPAILLFATIALVETCSWFGRSLRRLSRRTLRQVGRLERLRDDAPTGAATPT